MPADLLVIGEQSKQPSNPADRKWRCLQISKCAYQPLQLCGQGDDYFLIPLCPSDLPGRLLTQCHFSHLENHHLPFLQNWECKGNRKRKGVMLKDFKNKRLTYFNRFLMPVVKLFSLDILISDNTLSWEKNENRKHHDLNQFCC